MGLNASESKNTGGGGGNAPLLEPDTYVARLVVVADLGLQAQRPFKGEEKPPAYEILTTYELVDQFMKDEDGEDIKDKPRWQSESFVLYPLSSERATSTKRYNGIDGKNLYGGDWTKLVGEPCMVTLVHSPGKGQNQGKTYVNIANVSPVPSAMRDGVAELVNEPVIFDMDNPDLEAFNKLPNFVQEKIKGGLEFEGSALDGLLKSAPPKEEIPEDSPEYGKGANNPAASETGLDDEAPF